MSDLQDNPEQKKLAPKNSDWENKITIADIKDDVSSAKSTLDDQISKVANWLDYFYVRGEARPKQIKGRSNYVPRVIRKHFEWRCATLISPFISSPNLFKTAPRTYADVEAARKNGLVLNYQFNVLLNKQSLLDNYVRTCASEGTGIVKVGWEEKFITVTEDEDIYEYIVATTPEEQQEAMAMIQAYEQNPSLLNDPENKGYAEAINMSLKSARAGEKLVYIPRFLRTEQKLKKKRVRNQPTFEMCNIHDVTIDPSCKEDYTRARFVEHRFESSIAELEEEGIYDVQALRQINVEKAAISNDETQDELDGKPNQHFQFKDKRRKRILVHEYWRWHDAHNDGTLVPIVVTYCDNICIRIEENPYPDMEFPFVFIPYIPVKNSPYGEPDAEFLSDNQTLEGALTRSVIDTVGRNAAGQRGSSKTALDPVQFAKYKVGDDFMMNPNTNPDRDLWVAPPSDVPAAALTLLQQQKIDGESFTGTKTYSNQGLTGDALGSSVGGIKSAMGASALRDAEILARLVQGLKAIGRKIIAMNQEFLDPIEHVRITDSTFEEIKRDDLKGSIDIILTHSTAEEDNQRANELAFMIQTLGSNVSWEERAPLLTKLAELRKMPDLAEYYRTFKPEPDPLQQALAQLEVEKVQKENIILDAQVQEIQSKAMLNMAKTRKENSESDLNDLNFVQEESGVNSERKKDEIKSQAEGNIELEIIKSALASQNNLSNTNNA